MTPFTTAFDEYLQTIIELQTRVIEGQHTKLIQAAEKMAETPRADGRIFLFGTGHSHLLDERAQCPLAADLTFNRSEINWL